MKKVLTIAIAAIGIGLSSVTLADHERSRHGYKHHDKHVSAHYRHNARNYGHPGRHYGHQRANRHWKKHRAYRQYDHRPRHHRRYREVRHYHDNDAYKWIGGVYLLNEILHHNHH